MRKLILTGNGGRGPDSLAACNTVEGAGRDVSAAGHAVTDTAQDAK